MVKTEGSTIEKFKLLKEIGFDGVELNRPGGPPVDEILKACQTGAPVAGIMNSDHWKLPLSDPDPPSAQGLDSLRSALRDAQTFGAPTVLLVPAVVQKDVSYDDAWTRSQAEIRKVIPLAEELGVKIAIENVGNYFLLSPLEAARPWMNSKVRPSAGTSMWGISSAMAGPSSGFASWANGSLMCTSRKAAAPSLTTRVAGPKSNCSKETAIGRR